MTANLLALVLCKSRMVLHGQALGQTDCVSNVQPRSPPAEHVRLSRRDLACCRGPCDLFSRD